MKRRELLKTIALVTGGTVIGGELFLSGCKTGLKTEAGFTPQLIALLDEVGETIIPATDTPGAKAVQIGAFMKLWVTDCYTQEEQDAFMKGIKDLNSACKKLNGKEFMDCDAHQRHDFLVSLEKEAKAHDKKIEEDEKSKREMAKQEQKEFIGAPLHYYTMIKQMTLFGFFTSKTGATETLRHVQVPGKYDGAFPYTQGEKAWASSL
ncbi:MAG TPA: gluconate 2-dehydrogenase subunit 3 family protein [Chitinophagaceae bacterium]|nr:gluconate 2-dehydrogenase subunit 3 family protein [Chitinophagaceae bacterium]